MIHGCNRVFDAGLIRRLSHGELETLLAFPQFADNGTGIARPTVATIAEMTGTTPRLVRLAINGLLRLFVPSCLICFW
ncbi:MAG: hypothetical protein ABSH20_14015 [Tepidisphaeraceae bacterium]